MVYEDHLVWNTNILPQPLLPAGVQKADNDKQFLFRRQRRPPLLAEASELTTIEQARPGRAASAFLTKLQAQFHTSVKTFEAMPALGFIIEFQSALDRVDVPVPRSVLRVAQFWQLQSFQMTQPQTFVAMSATGRPLSHIQWFLKAQPQTTASY